MKGILKWMQIYTLMAMMNYLQNLGKNVVSIQVCLRFVHVDLVECKSTIL